VPQAETDVSRWVESKGGRSVSGFVFSCLVYCFMSVLLVGLCACLLDRTTFDLHPAIAYALVPRLGTVHFKNRSSPKTIKANSRRIHERRPSCRQIAQNGHDSHSLSLRSPSSSRRITITRRRWPQFYTLSRTRTRLALGVNSGILSSHVPKPAAYTIVLIPPAAVLRVFLLEVCNALISCSTLYLNVTSEYN